MSKVIERYATWLEEAEVGDSIRYLQADYAGRGPLVQKWFMAQAEAGKVFLYQKRVPGRTGVWNYYAKKLSPRAGQILHAWEIE